MNPIALTRFRHDKRGSVAVTAAIAAAALLGFGALALDGSNLYLAKRRQQGATDFAALSAASNLTGAAAAASATAQANGFAPGSISKIELGTYLSDATVPAAQRFSAQPTATPNAVRVTMRQLQPYILGSAVAGSQGSAGATIQTQSVAAARNVAAFAIGSSLATLNGGILNNVMSSLIGSSVSLSLMDYQALASTNVNLFTFSNALATRAGITAGTYTALLAGSASLSSALRATSDSVASSQASAALASLIAAVGTSTTTLSLGKLLDLSAYGGNSVGSAPPMTATVSALTLVSALLQAANGQQQLQTALSISVPGISSASLKIAVGEPPAGSSLIAVGPQGTTLTTAQTRLRLSLQVAGPAPTTLLSLPIVMNIASGTAVLTSLSCSGINGATASVQLGVTPGLVTAWVGTVSDTSLGTMGTPLNPTTATLVNVLGLMSVTGWASASIANPGQTAVSFSATDILNGTTKTVSTTDVLAPLLGNLFGNLSLHVWVLGLNALATSALNLSITQTLAADLSPMDQIISAVLVALGVSVGNATVWVSGAQCGQSVLVN